MAAKPVDNFMLVVIYNISSVYKIYKKLKNDMEIGQIIHAYQ